MDYENLVKEINNRQPENMTDLVTRALREAILEGEFEPGEKLVIKKMRKDFNVSRMPVRDAFRKLEAEGLVEIIPQKGTFVAEISVKQLQEIIKIRICLEKLAVKEAYKNITEENIFDLENTIQKQLNTDDKKKYFKYGSEFHYDLYNLSQNEELNNLISNIRGKFNRYLRLHADIYNGVNNVKEHKQILDSLKNDNLNKTLNLLENHILKVGEEIIDIVRKKSSKG